MITVDRIDEPLLQFKDKVDCVDPRVGLLLYGPAGLEGLDGGRETIKAAVIGTEQAVAQLRGFLARLRQVIPLEEKSEDDAWRIPFPGLGTSGPLGFDIATPPGLTTWIRDAEEREALKPDRREERIQNLEELYERKIDNLANTVNPAPDIIFFPLSQRALERCKDPRLQHDRIVSRSPYFASAVRGSHSPRYNFHHALKVLTFRHRIPCQLFHPSSLTFAKGTDDPATVAWNVTAAVYYKATGFPWKLANFDVGTCHVGLSFYVEHHPQQGRTVRTSMAHVYMRTAESQIIRGKPLPSRPDPKKAPDVPEADAKELMAGVVDLYKDQEGRAPSRIVVHQTAPFSDGEVAGFETAAGPNTQLDLLHLKRYGTPKFYHRDHGYPPVRGTLITSSGGPRFFLYTTGFVPALNTYPGSTTPNPIEVNPVRLDTNPYLVSRDILALTKLDWNTTSFAKREPVTIDVSRKVGHVLAEMRAQDTAPPQPYRYYM